MIIPIKCFTCGNVLADKYDHFKKEVSAEKTRNGEDVNKVIYLTKTIFVKQLKVKLWMI